MEIDANVIAHMKIYMSHIASIIKRFRLFQGHFVIRVECSEGVCTSPGESIYLPDGHATGRDTYLLSVLRNYWRCIFQGVSGGQSSATAW